MKLIALVDDSNYAASVCDHTAWLANRINAEVDIIHVLDHHNDSSVNLDDLSGSIGLGARSELLGELVELGARRAKLANKHGRAILDEAKSRIVNLGVHNVTCKLRNGDIVETIEYFESQADMVVIGKRGEAADFDTLLPGSNLERVVRSFNKPVLVASRAFKPINRILIAFDGGASIIRAIDYLVEHSAFSTIECELLAVTANRSDVENQLNRAAKQLSEAGYTVTTKIETGLAEKVIAREVESDGYDLLIMGAFGHSRIRNMMIGSTATEMVRACKIPILMLR